jgi:NADPH:quinone reductase-like Zn-dependent oxidoreductase
MKAIVQDQYGSADVLHLRDLDEPAIGAGEVLLRVHAAGVDPGVWHLMTGLPYLVRPAVGLRRPKIRVRGTDVSGRVERVGAGVTGLAPGDEVFGVGVGTYAELAVARADRLVRRPAGLSAPHAAAVPVSGMTALQALRDLRPGQRVLVFGAGGGVGTFAVQLAHLLGAAEVTGVGRPAKADLVRSLGATLSVTGPYDLIVDTAGNRPLRVLRALLTPTGTAVLVGGEGAGGRLLQGFDRQLRASVVGRRFRPLLSTPVRADLEKLAGLLADGSLRVVLDRTFPLTETAEAIRYASSGAARGKVVVTVAMK